MKSTKKLQKINDWIAFILLIIVAIVGCLRGDFWGGVATGWSLSGVIFLVIGKILLRKLRINKSIKDSMNNNQSN